MKIREILTESLSQGDAKQIIANFIQFAKTQLEIDQIPRITLFSDNKHGSEFRSFGGYGNRKIMLTIANRHIMDVCRTLAHELVHFRQDIRGQLNPNSGDDGSPEENEANAMAAVIMRKWGKLHPELFSQSAIE